MRVHVYNEELGEGVELVKKTADTGDTFYGLRIWLKTCQPLLDHSTPQDDDRSAVTFWAKDKNVLFDLACDLREAAAGEPS